MNGQPKTLDYDAPPGVELRKALVPYNHAATLETLQSGVVGNVGQTSRAQYVRAPESGALRGYANRPAATQRNNR